MADLAITNEVRVSGALPLIITVIGLPMNQQYRFGWLLIVDCCFFLHKQGDIATSLFGL